MRAAHRIVAVGVGASALLLVQASGAWAHECFVANRSAQGNASVAAHSSAWQSVTLHTVLTEFIGLPGPVAACVEEKAPAAGIPDSFVLGGKQAVGQGGVIAENNPNMATGKGSDGKGIDHGEDVYGPAIGALIGECSVGG